MDKLNKNYKYCGNCCNFSVRFENQNPIYCSCAAGKFDKMKWEDYQKSINKYCKEHKAV